MKGTAPVRVQGPDEPILGRLLREAGLDEPPLWKSRPPETKARMARWKELGKVRNGPVNPDRTEITDVAAATESFKQRALDLGATVVGVARLTPIMVAEGVDISHEFIFGLVVGENYEASLGGAALDRDRIHQHLCARCRDFDRAGPSCPPNGL
jgi:hypothetical protein